MALLTIAEEVKTALQESRPVLALESTVITHGLPYPFNLETARELEAAAREVGAVPATIALVDGRVQVGLDGETLERLAESAGKAAGAGGLEKVSLWNLPTVVAQAASGGTTVAATAHLARLAGLDVFATGGIGGVHPEPFDESADLTALSRTPVVVVCAGPKSVLNLPATLERLESLGVPVVGFGTDRFPAFHSPDSPLMAPARLDTPEQVADAFLAARELQLPQAILVVNPAREGLPYRQVQAWADQATVEARQKGVSGKALTPFLLRRLSELSRGETDRVNGLFLRENARLGARVAVALAGRRRSLA
ncbi:MAG TPA: pseudouridine-5'-phosphate glycosidase [Deinococcales bacterium]|nr:pseudouridine-5'-phosphate glycosidase [Deinococcales bacterium]